jgi:hypothetical protein
MCVYVNVCVCVVCVYVNVCVCVYIHISYIRWWATTQRKPADDVAYEYDDVTYVYDDVTYVYDDVT